MSASTVDNTNRSPAVARSIPVLAAGLLAALVLATFAPIVAFEFIEYDVGGQALLNPQIRGLSWAHLVEIFTSRNLTSYYPVRTLSFAIDYRLWGLSPGGFKLTNILIHLANTLLVFWFVLRLECTGAEGRAAGCFTPWHTFAAALGAAVFAIHPVVVEPVTWVAGREELLMALGTLGTLHFHLSARSHGETRSARARACRVAAAMCCAAACLSNAAAAVIPLLVTAWDLVTLDSPRLRKTAQGTWPLWAIGAATIVIKKLGPGRELLIGHAPLLSIDRLLLALEVYWLNLHTLFWPTDLAIIYDDPPPQAFLETWVILGALAAALSAALIWRFRRQKLVLVALLWFAIALLPGSQIVPHHWIRADRFLYLPLAMLTMAGAILLGRLADSAAPEKPLARRALPVAILAVAVSALCLLSRATAEQIPHWRNGISLWEHCVRVSPSSAVAHGALADALTKAGQFHRAVPHYRRSLDLDPANRDTLNNFALELAANADESLRDYDLAIELARRGCDVTEWRHPKPRRTLAMACNNHGLSLERGGKHREAAGRYAEAAAADPDYAAPLFNLALLLATSNDKKTRDPLAAVRVADHACQLVDYKDPNGLEILAVALDAAGEPQKAAAVRARAGSIDQP